jgi:hypothetical protein
MTTTSSIGPSPGRHQRKLRNLLLDPAFQLKYAGYLVVIAIFLSVTLGLALFRSSSTILAQSERNVVQGGQIVSLGREVVDESRKVSAVVRMNIVKDPVYQDNPDLLDAFNQDAELQNRRLEEQHRRLEEQSRSLVEQAASLRKFQKTLLWTLVGLLSALVVGIGLAGIFVTHKVAGPIYKMKRHLRDVTKGRLQVPWGLRKGDELVEFFEAFRQMVISLREARTREVEELERALAELREDISPVRLERLDRLRDSLRKGLAD